MPPIGQYLGIVSDSDLNLLYNSADFVLLPSRFEGIGLSMIEAMITGSIPITCSDNPTAIEFCPPEFICEPDYKSLADRILHLSKDYAKYSSISLSYGLKYREQFNKISVCKNILKLYENRYHI